MCTTALTYPLLKNIFLTGPHFENHGSLGERSFKMYSSVLPESDFLLTLNFERIAKLMPTQNTEEGGGLSSQRVACGHRGHQDRKIVPEKKLQRLPVLVTRTY